jgi:hypothetical protein
MKIKEMARTILHFALNYIFSLSLFYFQKHFIYFESKQTCAIYFFKVGMTKMKCQNKRQNNTNFNLSCCFRGTYNCCKH